ncbi:hypothetical protein N0V90_001058 [Kalmusia sp. IMI 367209]|nr:hypothetical protein N0V90_001058 [Kalmusia sp. IMI 367209]
MSDYNMSDAPAESPAAGPNRQPSEAGSLSELDQELLGLATEPTDDEKIEQLEKKVERLEKLLESIQSVASDNQLAMYKVLEEKQETELELSDARAKVAKIRLERDEADNKVQELRREVEVKDEALRGEG